MTGITMNDLRQTLVQDGRQHADQTGRLADGDWVIEWRTLRGGVSEGVQVVTLSNGTFQVDVCPTRGMGVLQARHNDTTIGWSSPNRAPVHPAYVNLKSRNGLGWLDGFSELLCRCGLSFNGPPGNDKGARSPIESDLTLHGRIANLPAHTVEVGFDAERAEGWIVGECRESTLFGPNLLLQSVLRVPLEGSQFDVSDTVVNHASSPAELQLLYHINLGAPFLEAGSRFQTAFAEMSPRDDRAAQDIDTWDEYLGPTAGYAEQVYFFDPLSDKQGWSRALLRNREATRGVSVAFNREQLPCLSQWKCTQAEADGYVTGIEPGTNFPNFKSLERTRGRVISLEGGASYQTELSVAVHPSADAVDAVAESIVRQQGGVKPVIHGRATQPLAAQ
jgi:hypothetical protein